MAAPKGKKINLQNKKTNKRESLVGLYFYMLQVDYSFTSTKQ